MEKELKFKLLFWEEEGEFHPEDEWEDFEKYFKAWQKIQKNFVSPVFRWEDGFREDGHWNNELYTSDDPLGLFWVKEWDNAPGYSKSERWVFVFVP